MAAERPVFDIFGVFFVVNFMIGPSLMGLHWLEGGGVVGLGGSFLY